MDSERIRIREIIQNAAGDLYNSIADEDLKWLVGSIISLNEEYVINNPDTIGAQEILENGFTDNQKTWIINLKKKLNGMKKEK